MFWGLGPVCSFNKTIQGFPLINISFPHPRILLLVFVRQLARERLGWGRTLQGYRIRSKSVESSPKSLELWWNISHMEMKTPNFNLTWFLSWTLLRISGEFEFSGKISVGSSSFLVGSSIAKLEARTGALFLPTDLVLLPVNPALIDTFGVLTTNEDKDLSFLLTGSEIEGVTSGVLIFLLKGKILALMSCKLWSGLHIFSK